MNLHQNQGAWDNNTMISSKTYPNRPCWDIFCQVIDNFGDIGVCWRLARQLASEHHLAVRLWVDDLASLQRLCPEIDPHAEVQHHSSVEIRQWSAQFPDTQPADVVIEAFGCTLPERYVRAMAAVSTKPIWINLEYLTAESWVEDCHAMPSPHPSLPLTKYFFFPGFTAATGGLLRESDLLLKRDTLQAQRNCLWEELQIPCPAPQETTISLFCYDTAPIADLLAGWEQADTPVRCYVPEGKALPQVAQYFHATQWAVGDTLSRGNLTVHITPFLRQEQYDLLLWACDFNFVRGEDSFVRAQWAGKPFIWQIYVQEEDTHLVKLDAFLARYCQKLPEHVAEAVRQFHQGWNRHGVLDWKGLMHHRHLLEAHAGIWGKGLAEQTDLASNLVIFCKIRV
jgi:uncharacterized repeat protein (TIGR03837 family)